LLSLLYGPLVAVEILMLVRAVPRALHEIGDLERRARAHVERGAAT